MAMVQDPVTSSLVDPSLKLHHLYPESHDGETNVFDPKISQDPSPHGSTTTNLPRGCQVGLGPQDRTSILKQTGRSANGLSQCPMRENMKIPNSFDM